VNEFGPAGTNYGFGGTGTKNPLWTSNSAESARAMIGSLGTPAQLSEAYRNMYFFGGIDVTNLKYQDAATAGRQELLALPIPIDREAGCRGGDNT